MRCISLIQKWQGKGGKWNCNSSPQIFGILHKLVHCKCVITCKLWSRKIGYQELHVYATPEICECMVLKVEIGLHVIIPIVWLINLRVMLPQSVFVKILIVVRLDSCLNLWQWLVKM